ncbi:hypothetical protein GmRootA79_11150 [Acidovorax sp. A79]|uniref:pilus assembly PilX family protein n=1 Tax=Acidovorax sp. A79 TaxID=3056107 RepID=UPI0034E8E794
MFTQRMQPLRFQHPRQNQRGISLIVVIVFVMLSMLLALWASRTSMFNEMVVGNDADYQRAFEAAQALLLDAELDIRGEKADGSDCRVPTATACRFGRTNQAQIPLEAKEAAALLAQLEGITTGPRCIDALCLKRPGRQDFWNNTGSTADVTTQGEDVSLEQMMASADGNRIGARYGQYSGADAGSASNPILQIGNKGADATRNNEGGWYWIEVLPYDSDADKSRLIAGGASNLPLNLQPSVVYRITAVAHGRKLKTEGGSDVPITRVVLQQTYARQKLVD